MRIGVGNWRNAEPPRHVHAFATALPVCSFRRDHLPRGCWLLVGAGVRSRNAVAIAHVIDEKCLIHRSPGRSAVHSPGGRAPAMHSESADLAAKIPLHVINLREIPGVDAIGPKAETDVRPVKALN